MACRRGNGSTSNSSWRSPGSDESPGRIILAAPSHGLRGLADAIDTGFGRRGQGRIRTFLELGEGEYEVSGQAAGTDLDPGVESTELSEVFFPGLSFTYLSADEVSWVHRGTVSRTTADPRSAWPAGRLPRHPFVADGWGALPDPFGRRSRFEGAGTSASDAGRPPAQVSERDIAMSELYCQKKVPERVRDQLKLEVEVRGGTMTMVERRPPWNPELVGPDWTRNKVAQFTLQPDGSWTLQCQLSDLRWHEYEPLPGHPELAVLLAEVDEDPTAIFWG